MDFNKIVSKAKEYFPQLAIKYKDQSNFMKLLGYILFFNKSFMKNYTTTIGSTIYFPKETFIKSLPLSATTILLHELVHIHDSIRFTNLVYSLLYLFPISLLPITLLLFFFSWKIALILTILCMLPVPAYFRMYFERRAYLASLYVIKAMYNKLGSEPNLDKNKEIYLSQFKSSAYYFMWIFPLNKQFDEALIKIKAGKHPYDDPVFNILDDLLSQVDVS